MKFKIGTNEPFEVNNGTKSINLVNAATSTDITNNCPVVEDTRASQVAAITCNAPFSQLVGGQRIILHTKYASVYPATLQLTLSNGTTTSALAIFGQYGITRRQVIGDMIKNCYYNLVYDSTANCWFTMTSDSDTNTTYSTLTNSDISSSGTGTRVVTGKVLRDNFYTKSNVDEKFSNLYVEAVSLGDLKNINPIVGSIARVPATFVSMPYDDIADETLLFDFVVDTTQPFPTLTNDDRLADGVRIFYDRNSSTWALGFPDAPDDTWLKLGDNSWNVVRGSNFDAEHTPTSRHKRSESTFPWLSCLVISTYNYYVGDGYTWHPLNDDVMLERYDSVAEMQAAKVEGETLAIVAPTVMGYRPINEIGANERIYGLAVDTTKTPPLLTDVGRYDGRIAVSDNDRIFGTMEEGEFTLAVKWLDPYHVVSREEYQDTDLSALNDAFVANAYYADNMVINNPDFDILLARIKVRDMSVPARYFLYTDGEWVEFYTKSKIENLCPIIEDTRSSAVAAITGVAPFSQLVDGQRILLHLAFPNLSYPTLQLTLSNGTPTSVYDIYGQISTNVTKLAQGYYRPGVYLPMIFASNRWNVIADANTLYDAITQALLDVGTDMGNRLISSKLLCDNFSKVTTLVEVTATGDVTQALESGKFYKFGSLDSLTLTLTAAAAGMAQYGGKFTASANWSALGLPATVDEAAGNDTIAGGKTYEFNVLDNVIVIKEV